MNVACSVCGSDQSEQYLTEEHYTVVRCCSCGHLYTSPLPSLEKIALTYAASGDWIKTTDIQQSSGSDSRFDQYRTQLEDRVEPGGCILEIGCSKGRFLYTLQSAGFDCYGVEPSNDAYAASQLLGEKRIWHRTYDQLLPVIPDAIVMLEVLEHIPEPHKTIALVRQQLKPGGYFMGSIPNADFIRMKVWPKRLIGIQSFIVPLIMDAGNHINYFSAYGINRMLYNHGFNVLWIRNSPLDFNYLSNRFSPLLKHLWYFIAQNTQRATGRLIGSNIWFLAQRPVQD